MTVENIDSERLKTDEIEVTESPGKVEGTPDSQATECANNANRTGVTPMRPATMKQLQLPVEIRRNNRVIYSLRLKVTKTTDPLKTMQHALREWFKMMKQCSPSFVVYKWKDQTFQSAITSTNNITANPFQMKIFLTT